MIKIPKNIKQNKSKKMIKLKTILIREIFLMIRMMEKYWNKKKKQLMPNNKLKTKFITTFNIIKIIFNNKIFF